MRYLKFGALLSLFALAFVSLYFKRPTDFAIFYSAALIFGEISGRTKT